MLAKADCDVVAIATPSGLHPVQEIQAGRLANRAAAMLESSEFARRFLGQ